MINPRSVSFVITGMLLVLLYSCSADGGSASTALGPCNAEAAQQLVGREKPTDEKAIQLTGAKTVRQVQPGDMVTQDFREDRVTIETDPATALVTRATCG